MNNKRELLKYKKAILAATMAGTFTLTGCAQQENIKREEVYEQIDENKFKNPVYVTSKDDKKLLDEVKELVTSNIYVNEKGNVVYEKAPNVNVDEKGKVYYTVPSGYALARDEDGNIVARKEISKKTR